MLNTKQFCLISNSQLQAPTGHDMFIFKGLKLIITLFFRHSFDYFLDLLIVWFVEIQKMGTNAIIIIWS